jgi:hypothetical protein
MAPKRSRQVVRLESEGDELLKSYPQMAQIFRDVGWFVMYEHHSMLAACQPTSTSSMHLMKKGRGTILSILKFEISITVVRILMLDHAFVQLVVEVSFNGCLQQAQDIVRTGHPYI